MAELMIVLVIFGILTVMAAPRINLSPGRTRAAANQTGSILLAAQRAAVARQQNVVIAFDATGRRVRVHYDTNNDGTVQTGEQAVWQPLPEGVVFGRAAAPAGRAGTAAISFKRKQNGFPALVFLRNGSASEEGGFYLTTANDVSKNRSINVRQVVVERATGRPTWLAYDGSKWKTEF